MESMIHETAGKFSQNLINQSELENRFYNPDNVSDVKFGTSGHRGKLGNGFSQLHAQAIAQAVARLHKERSIEGPILVGGDTRLMSEQTAIICAEVLSANGFTVIVSKTPLPTPVFSFEILNKRAVASLNATASHNPPEDMGLKYNPSSGGPADSETTKTIEKYANEYLKNPSQIKRISLERAKAQDLIKTRNLVTDYVKSLSQKVDLLAIQNSGLRIAIHPLGGTSIPFYEEIIKANGLSKMQIVDKTLNPNFGFIPLDHDGKIRMDPSSEYPMSPLLKLIEDGSYDFAGASDPDADRFGVATPNGGLIPPNHALAVALSYLLRVRDNFPKTLKAGRTVGTTHLLDRICQKYNRQIEETNVGFKWFVDGFLNDEYLMAGEESAGLSVYRWTTEKDGILAVMLLAEITALTGKDIADLYKMITADLGTPFYKRIDVSLDEKTKANIQSLNEDKLSGLNELAGEKVEHMRFSDGIKFYTENSWLLTRLSGTEPVAKFYAESFNSEEHLNRLFASAENIFNTKIL
jgi:phosphoglucomutase